MKEKANLVFYDCIKCMGGCFSQHWFLPAQSKFCYRSKNLPKCTPENTTTAHRNNLRITKAYVFFNGGWEAYLLTQVRYLSFSVSINGTDRSHRKQTFCYRTGENWPSTRPRPTGMGIKS